MCQTSIEDYIDIRHAEARDNADLLALMANSPMRGPIELCFEKQPDFFRSMHSIAPNFKVLVAVDRRYDKVVASIASAFRPLYINGAIEDVCYVIGLRLLPEYQGQGILHLMAKPFEATLKGQWSHNAILQGNKKVEQIFLRKMPEGIPQIHKHGAIHTYLVYARRSYKPKVLAGVEFRRATEHDTEQMQALHDRQAPSYQFYPRYDFSALQTSDPYYQDLEITDFLLAFEHGKLVAMAGLWNQEGHKQTRIVGLHPGLKMLRMLLNPLFKVLGGPRLPRIGENLNYLAVTGLICPHQRTDILTEMLAQMRQTAYREGAVGLSMSFDSKDTRSVALKGFKKQLLKSHHAILTLVDMPYPEFDGRPAYIEVCRF